MGQSRRNEALAESQPGIANGERTPAEWASDADAALMVQARDGDDGAFDALYRRHRKRLVAAASRLIGDPERAEELVQEAFLRIYSVRDRYEPRAAFASYIHRVAKNLCLNDRRRESQARFVSLDTGCGDDPVQRRQIPDQRICGPETRVGDAELLTRIGAAIEDGHRRGMEALLLRRLHGYSYRQLADRFATSESAVKCLVHRGTRTLREELNHLLDEGESR